MIIEKRPPVKSNQQMAAYAESQTNETPGGGGVGRGVRVVREPPIPRASAIPLSPVEDMVGNREGTQKCNRTPLRASRREVQKRICSKTGAGWEEGEGVEAEADVVVAGGCSS